MGRILSVLPLLVLLAPVQGVSAQVDPPDPAPSGEPQSGFTLGQNYPNPFNPETRIPFELHEGLFADGGTAIVSIHIFNVLVQPVASPTALNHPAGQAPLVDLEYVSPGTYEAYWDGRDQFGREVASGIYFVQLTVNGQRDLKRMYVAK
jgi:hypothetical protein